LLDRVLEEDIISTSNIDPEMKSGGFSYRAVVKAKPDVEEGKLRLLKDLILENQSIPTFQLLLLDAKKALDERNYSISIVYGITALESIVRQYFDKVAAIRGFSKKAAMNIGLSSLVTVLLRMTLDKDKLSDRLIHEFKEANNKRNEIIHRAEMNVDRGEAIRAFNTVRQLIEILVSNMM
jgi:hypothetical protein